MFSLLDVGNPAGLIAIGIGVIIVILILIVAVIVGIVAICKHIYKKRKTETEGAASDVSEVKKSEE